MEKNDLTYKESGTGEHTLRWFESDPWSVFLDPDGDPIGFEHHEYGDEYGGGLWIESGHLVDYDGVYNLPKKVIYICEALGFNMDYAKDDDYGQKAESNA